MNNGKGASKEETAGDTTLNKVRKRLSDRPDYDPIWSQILFSMSFL